MRKQMRKKISDLNVTECKTIFGGSKKVWKRTNGDWLTKWLKTLT